MKLNAKQLRSYSGKLDDSSTSKPENQPPKNDIYIILDNVLDTYNIGSIFRLADAISAKKIYICGQSEIPPNHRIKKASINTTEWVDWEYSSTAVEAIKNLKFKIKNLQVVAIEQDKKSVQYDQFEYTLPICFIVGNETTGVAKETLKACDAIVELPMFGVNISLNVIVSLGIVLYKALEETH